MSESMQSIGNILLLSGSKGTMQKKIMWECWNGIFRSFLAVFSMSEYAREVKRLVSFVSKINIYLKLWPLDKICYLAIQDRPDTSTLDDFFWFRFVLSLACTKRHWWWSRARGKRSVFALLNGCYPFSFVFFCCSGMVVCLPGFFFHHERRVYTKGDPLSLTQNCFDYRQNLLWWPTGVFNISTRFREGKLFFI